MLGGARSRKRPGAPPSSVAGGCMAEEYVTIQGEARDEFIERKSRFIGFIRHVETEAEALSFIQEIRQKHWDATHNVYAYLLRDQSLQRYSDDGEPQGTAGIPVLSVLQKEGIVDVCVVVTRYFGGILLGGGGLVRAYSHGASLAVEAAQKLYMAPCLEISLRFDYSLYGKITYLFPKYSIETLASDFNERVCLRLLIKKSAYHAFAEELTELTGGSVSPTVEKEKYASIK